MGDPGGECVRAPARLWRKISSFPRSLLSLWSMINSVRRRFTSVQLEVDYNRIRACVRACINLHRRYIYWKDVTQVEFVFASFNVND